MEWFWGPWGPIGPFPGPAVEGIYSSKHVKAVPHTPTLNSSPSHDILYVVFVFFVCATSSLFVFVVAPSLWLY